MPMRDREIQKLEQRCREGISIRYSEALRPQVVTCLVRELGIIDRLKQAKDILRGLSVVETLITQGKPLNDALDEAAQAVGPDGKMVLSDLVIRLRTAPADEAALAVREWTTAWDNPAVDIFCARLEPGSLAPVYDAVLLGGVVKILGQTKEGTPLTFIPYFLWGNRGPSQMNVWVHI